MIIDHFLVTLFGTNPDIIAYDQINCKNGQLYIGKELYKNADVKVRELYNLIQMFSEITAEKQ